MASPDTTSTKTKRPGHEIQGLFIIMIAVLAFGTFWTPITGIAGDYVDRVFAWLIGLVRKVLPLWIFVLGLMTLGGTWSGFSMTRKNNNSEGLRISHRAGNFLILVAATSYLHIVRGLPGFPGFNWVNWAESNMGDSGGVLGLVVGGFLHAWFSLGGSMIIICFIALIGIMKITQVTIGMGFRFVGQLFTTIWKDLFESKKKIPRKPIVDKQPKKTFQTERFQL